MMGVVRRPWCGTLCLCKKQSNRYALWKTEEVGAGWGDLSLGKMALKKIQNAKPKRIGA